MAERRSRDSRPAPPPRPQIDQNGLLPGEADRMRAILAARSAPPTPSALTFQDITGVSPEEAERQAAAARVPVMTEGSHQERDPGAVEAWDGRSRGGIGGTAIGGFGQGLLDTVRSFDTMALRLGADVADVGGNLVPGGGGDNARARCAAVRR